MINLLQFIDILGLRNEFASAERNNVRELDLCDLNVYLRSFSAFYKGQPIKNVGIVYFKGAFYAIVTGAKIGRLKVNLSECYIHIPTNFANLFYEFGFCEKGVKEVPKLSRILDLCKNIAIKYAFKFNEETGVFDTSESVYSFYFDGKLYQTQITINAISNLNFNDINSIAVISTRGKNGISRIIQLSEIYILKCKIS